MKFRHVSPRPEHPRIPVLVNGETFHARKGQNLALALLEAGVPAFNIKPGSGAPRAPFCLMGTCFECRVIVNGARDTLACRTKTEPGMIVETQDYDAEQG